MFGNKFLFYLHTGCQSICSLPEKFAPQIGLRTCALGAPLEVVDAVYRLVINCGDEAAAENNQVERGRTYVVYREVRRPAC